VFFRAGLIQRRAVINLMDRVRDPGGSTARSTIQLHFSINSFVVLVTPLRRYLKKIRSRRNRLCATAAMVVLALISAACSPDEGLSQPDLLRIGVLPDQGRDQLIDRYAPLAEYLAEELSVPVKIRVPRSYDHLLELFHDKEVDLAYFGGITFVQANLQSGAVPLVMRDVDAKFTSYFIVRTGETAKNIRDLAGRRLGFGSRQSTSGHFMPRYFLLQSKILAEDFFGDIIYSGAHDRTALLVRDGKADLGVANSAVIDSMIEDGRLRSNEIRVLWETPPYADYVWSLRPGFNESFVNRLRDAFLGLSRQNVRQAKILERLGAQIFIPAGTSDFSQLKALFAEMSARGQGN
jgi:phosphonate transport system substrate-binding protein